MHQRVEVDDRPHRVERPRLPLGHLVDHRVGDRRDQARRDLGAVDLGQVRLDVAHRHPARVHREDLVVEAVEAALMLLHQLRLERAVADRAAPRSGSRPARWSGFLGEVPLRALPRGRRSRRPARSPRCSVSSAPSARSTSAPVSCFSSPSGPVRSSGFFVAQPAARREVPCESFASWCPFLYGKRLPASRDQTLTQNSVQAQHSRWLARPA